MLLIIIHGIDILILYIRA